MKFSMKCGNLINALDRMNRIGTKGIKTDYELSGHVTMDVQDSKVLFKTSNGYLSGCLEVTRETDSALSITKTGKSTVDVAVFRNIAKVIGGEDIVVNVEESDGLLHILHSEGRKKKKTKIEVHKNHHDFEIKKDPKGFSYDFPVGILRQGFSVGKYKSPMQHRIEYHMICIHFMKEQIRFICGSGMIFCILSYIADGKQDVAGEVLAPPSVDDNGKKCIIPADQADIITSVIGNDTSKLTITYDSYTSCFINSHNGMLLHLKGMPNIEYIKYEEHAFGNSKAIEAVVEVQNSDFVDGINLVNSVRDKQAENEGMFHTAKFEAAEGKDVKISVSEGRYQCEFICPSNFKKLLAPEFSSEYAAAFLTHVAEACGGKDIVRFNCSDRYGTITASPCMEKGTDNPSILFFFSCALEREE